MISKKKKQTVEDCSSENESGSDYETQSRKRKYFVEDSSSETEFDDLTEEIQQFLVNQKKKKTNEKAAQEMQEKRANIPEARLPSTEAHYDFSETMSEVNLESENDPMFQTQTDQSSVNKPSDSITPQPHQAANGTPTEPAAPSKIQPAPQATAALMMMARAVSFVPKKFPTPSFSLGFTDSSQEETLN
ncbi:hypothetical protein AHAS_Ahas18G0094100 [Arachis hypogaea]